MQCQNSTHNQQNRESHFTHVPVQTISLIFNSSNTHAIRKVTSITGKIAYYAITTIDTTYTIMNPFMYSVLPKTHKSVPTTLHLAYNPVHTVPKNINKKKYHINNYVKWINDSYFIVASSKNKNKQSILYQLFYIDKTNPNPVFIIYIPAITQPTAAYPIMKLDSNASYISSITNISDPTKCTMETKEQLILSYSALPTFKHIRDWHIKKIIDLPYRSH